jgi:hypothetical protein
VESIEIVAELISKEEGPRVRISVPPELLKYMVPSVVEPEPGDT